MSIKVINAIFVGVLLSNIIIVGLYIPDMIADTRKDDMVYVIAYVILCIFFYAVYFPYVLLKNNRDCIIKCKCCHRYSYLDELNSES